MWLAVPVLVAGINAIWLSFTVAPIARALPASTALAEADRAEPVLVCADLDGDGIDDVATLVQDRSHVSLYVKVGSLPSQRFRFDVRPDAQDALCTVPVTLGASRLVCRPDGPGGRVLQGCAEAPGKVALTIADGSCDAIHVYWNRETGQLTWWRR